MPLQHLQQAWPTGACIAVARRCRRVLARVLPCDRAAQRTGAEEEAESAFPPAAGRSGPPLPLGGTEKQASGWLVVVGC